MCTIPLIQNQIDSVRTISSVVIVNPLPLQQLRLSAYFIFISKTKPFSYMYFDKLSYQ